MKKDTSEELIKLRNMKTELRSVVEILPETRLILRLDTDLPIEDGVILDNSRLKKSIKTIEFLLKNNCKIAIIGHRGRPTDKDENLSLKTVYLELVSLLEENYIEVESVFVENFEDNEKIDLALAANQIVFMENLRFWRGEEENDPTFLKALMEVTQYFVNDAFGVAHRRQASITLHKLMPAFYGLSFLDEVRKIEEVLENPKHPIMVILGGAKTDKLTYLPGLLKIADQVLVGGKLPALIQDSLQPPFDIEKEKLVVADLKENGLDINEESIHKFKEIIERGGTIIWSGAMGNFEVEENQRGTSEIALAVASSDAYKIIAGGDTRASLIKLGVLERINFVCSGGGALLELLTKGSLAAWE